MSVLQYASDRTNEIVRFEVPGQARILTKEEIAKEYGERATRPIPPGYTRKKKIGVRLVRDRPFFVAKVFESGHRKVQSEHDTWEAAEAEAGRLRDAMTDADCAKDFNYQAFQRQRGAKKAFR